MASILVLDDRAVERELLEVVLSSAGHTVLQCSNGADALALARAELPELIIVDVLVPEMDGYEFVQELREDTAIAASRVILCTATFDEDEVRHLARACDVTHVMVKPIAPQELLLVVEAALTAKPMPVRPKPPGRFGREQLRAANAKLIEKVAELDRADEVRRLLAAIVESSDDAIIATTLEGKIMSWNHGAENLYGYTAEEAVGEPIAVLVPPERGGELSEIMELLKHGGPAARLDTVRVRNGGAPVDVAVTISPIYNDTGKLTGAATIARDISVRKQAEREFALAHRAAVETVRARSEFLANMSHEIRTPLNGVVGMTGLLADTPLSGLQHEYLDALGASNEALLAVVNEVLDFSTLEAGHVELETSELDVRATVEEALLTLTAPARAKGLEISHQVDADVTAVVRGDRARVRQVLLSLLSNAVKFTTSGEVGLHVSVAEDERLRFAISDTGVGIDDATSASLFEAFAQADPSSTRRHGGTGLGLAISQQLVTLMDGQIGAESRGGGGARFWFTATLPAAASVAAPPHERLDLLGLRALIVSDGEIERTVLDRYLRELGLACTSAEPGAAIAELEGASRTGRQFELAVLDFDQPQLSCVELVHAIRERPKLGAVRVVMLSAFRRDRESFADDATTIVIPSPARPSEIRDAIGEVVGAKASPMANVSGAAGLASPAAAAEHRSDARSEETGPTGEPDGPLVLLAEDDPTNRSVAAALLRKRGVRTAIAHHGREAVYMAGESSFDAIIMDCQLPEIDGYEATRRIHEAERPHHTPVIALTAHALPGDRERCLGAGMDDYVAKPVHADAFYEVLERWLPREPARAEHAQRRGVSPDGVSPEGVRPEGVRPEGVRPEGVEDEGLVDQDTIDQLKDTLTPEMLEQLLRTFEQSLPRRLADIATAARSGDQPELRRLAHVLKGSSATIGAARLSAAAHELEQLGGEPDTTVGQEQLEALEATATASCPALRGHLL